MWWYLQDNYFHEEGIKPPLRVLIFEDNKYLRDAMKMRFGLESKWLSVGICDTSSNMLAIVSRMSPYGANNPDVIVLDVSAEGQDVGIDIFTAIRDTQLQQQNELKHFVDPTIIFYTSNTDALESGPRKSKIDGKNRELYGSNIPELFIVPKGEDMKLLDKLGEIHTNMQLPVPARV